MSDDRSDNRKVINLRDWPARPGGLYVGARISACAVHWWKERVRFSWPDASASTWGKPTRSTVHAEKQRYAESHFRDLADAVTTELTRAQTRFGTSSWDNDAVAQNVCVLVEKMMGIYPNVEPR